MGILGDNVTITDDVIDSLVCPPPPLDPPTIDDRAISDLIVPKPQDWGKFHNFVMYTYTARYLDLFKSNRLECTIRER